MTLEKVDCPFCDSKSATIDLPLTMGPGDYLVPFSCPDCGNSLDIAVHLKKNAPSEEVKDKN